MNGKLYDTIATTVTTTITTTYLRVVKLVVGEEVDGVLVKRHVDLADGVVGGRFRVTG